MFKVSRNVFTLALATALPAFAAESKPSIDWHLYADGYYSHNFNRPSAVVPPNGGSLSSSSLPDAKNLYRYYDTYPNQFTLNLVELSVNAKMEEVSFLADFDFGPFADLNTATGSTSTNNRAMDEVSKHVGQAVISYRKEGSAFFFDAGKMYSHIGLETVKAKDNFNYSRTVLFSYGMPFWHTGLRVGYDIAPEKLQASLFVYNGWNSIYDNNHEKTLGGQVKYIPNPSLTILYNYIGGAERTDSQTDRKTVHEVNGSWTVSSSLTLAADALWGMERNVQVNSWATNAQWYGGLIAAKYLLNEISFLSPRFEIFRDQHGYILSAAPQSIKSATLTYGRTLAKGLDLRTEGRWDSSSQKPFSKGLAAKNSQTTLLAALLFTY